MFTNSFIDTIIKVFFINISIYIVFIRIINKENFVSETIKIFLTSIAVAIYYAILRNYTSLLITNIISYLIYTTLLMIIIKKSFLNYIVAIIVSFLISLLLFAIASFIGIVFLEIIGLKVDEISIKFFIYGIVQLLLLQFLFKIKRFKNGFHFLQNNNKLLNNIMILLIIMSLNIVIIFNLISINFDVNDSLRTYLLGIIILIAISLIVWIYREISSYYQVTQMEKSLDIQEKELIEKDEEINKLANENSRLASVIHKYNNRFEALELSVKEYKLNNKRNLIKSYNTEIAPEYSDILDNIKKISSEFSNEIEENIEEDKKLPLTNIYGIDSLLNYMSKEANKNNIEFNLKINGNIDYMIDNFIEQSKLETLLGDHIKDAIIAVKLKDIEDGNIMVILGKVKGVYGLCVYDNGVEFEKETLMELGLKPITTHSANEGKGIGFMTTFKMLNETKATLIIEEYKVNKFKFTKAVIVHFNGKNEYIIKTYRSQEFIDINKDNRITIENI